MTIDWDHFTPWASLTGGVLIGVAAALLLLFSGRIAGVSGILGSLLAPKKADTAWRVLFIAGLLLAAPLAQLVLGRGVEARIDSPFPVLALAGLLVGLGTSYASGCTSGHGVCGLSRLSPRSLVATVAFMGAGMAAVFFARHFA
jgi:uncharacterized membrane protein YedE/YeeE